VAILRGREAALIREHNDRAWLAWHIAYLSRTKKPVALRKLQIKSGSARRKPQSWQQMKTVALMITQAFGGTVTPESE
jgi:hypothetical protein